MAVTLLVAEPRLNGERILESGEQLECGKTLVGWRPFGCGGQLEAVASTSKQWSDS